MLNSLIKTIKEPICWLINPANLHRVFGSRVQIIACVVSRNPVPSILLAKSVYKGAWMPPQEGVNIKENFNEALARCLKEECNLVISQGSETYYVRSIGYVGKIKLASSRRGERLVADNANHTWLEYIKLRSKAYWVGLVMISDQTKIKPVPNAKEILELEWFPIEEARKLVVNTNESPKAKLLQKVLDKCELALLGN